MGKMIRWTLLFVVLVIFASGGIAFYTVFLRPTNDITIPLLRERSVIDAVSEAERLGFTVQLEQVTSSLPEGRVLGQSPEAGTRARKSQVVVLQVSKGGELRAVPDVRGQPLARAQSLLKEQGFDMGDVVRIPDGSKPGGSVIAQSPAAPANIALGRKVSLLVANGTGPGGAVIVPDVNRMTEQEARKLLEDSGLRIEAIERVYSAVMPEGLAIETRPGSGTALKEGDGVRLKVATLKQPSGFGSPTSGQSGKTTSTTTSQPSQQEEPIQVAPKTGGSTSRTIVVQVPGQGDVFVGDGMTPEDTPITEANPNISVYDQERRPAGQTGQSQNTVRPVQPQTPVQQPVQPTQPKQPAQQSPSPSASTGSSSGNKTARIRYQVPPLVSPMSLKIDVTDPNGTRTILSRQANSMESISIQTSYSQECHVSIYLGGNQVWQEKFQ